MSASMPVPESSSVFPGNGSRLPESDRLERGAEDLRENALLLTRLLENIGSQASVRDVARSTVEAVCQSFGWAYGSYSQVENGVLTVVADYGSVGDALRKASVQSQLREGQGLAGRA